MTLSPISVGLLGALGLMAVGFYGLLAARNLIRVVIALQILVKSALLGLVIAGTASGRINVAQSMAITVIVADTVVAVIGIALAVQVRRQLGTLDVREISRLRG
jgi:NADH-quinone oxidoreductase subunit K